MKYNYYQGLIKERISKLALLTIALLFALTAAMATFAAVSASQTVVTVTESNLEGWNEVNVRGDGESRIDGAPDSQGGNASLRQSSSDGNGKTDFRLLENFGAIEEVESLSFEWYRDVTSTAPGHLTPAVGVFVADDAGNSWLLKWEGTYNGYPTTGPAVPTNEWVAEDLIVGNYWRIPQFIEGDWVGFAGCNEAGDPYECFQYDRNLGDEWLEGYDVAGVEIGIGSGWNGTFLSYADHLTIGDTTYDFEVEEAPEAPTNLTVVDSSGNMITNGAWTNSSSITTSWDEVDGAVAYEYSYWNNIESSPYYTEANRWIVDNGASLSRSGVFNQGEGLHYIEVRAVGSSGLESEWSDTFTVGYDKTAPTVSAAILNDVAVDDAHIRSKNCEAIKQTYTVSGEFDFNAMITDELSGVKNATYRVRAMTNGGCTLTSVFSSPRVNLQYDETLNKWVIPDAFDVSELADGLYTIMLASTDGAGNQITNYIDLQVDNSPKNMEECKNGGWMGYYRNQGFCVSEFATVNARGNALGNRR